MMGTFFILSFVSFLFLTTRSNVRKTQALFVHCLLMSIALACLSISSFFRLSLIEVTGYLLMLLSLIPLYRRVRDV